MSACRLAAVQMAPLQRIVLPVGSASSSKGGETSAAAARLKEFKKTHGRTCADCGDFGPIYIVLPYGIFVCVTCAGLHRELSHSVKGVSTSEWTAREAAEVEARGGNEAVLAVLKAACTEPLPQQPKVGELRALRVWIKTLYPGVASDSAESATLAKAPQSNAALPPVSSGASAAAAAPPVAPSFDLLDLESTGAPATMADAPVASSAAAAPRLVSRISVIDVHNFLPVRSR